MWEKKREHNGGEGSKAERGGYRAPEMLAAFKEMNSLVRAPFLFPRAKGNQCKAVQPHTILKEMHNLNGEQRLLWKKHNQTEGYLSGQSTTQGHGRWQDEEHGGK